MSAGFTGDVASGVDGVPQFIHRYLGVADDSAPLLALFHGTGGDESNLIDLGRALCQNGHLLGVRGRSLEEGRNRFFRRYSEGVFDEYDIRLQASDLEKFIKAFRADRNLTGQTVAVGYSNGANMAAAMLLLQPTVFDVAILFRPMEPLEPQEIPDLSRKRVFIASGRHDPLGPLQSAERLADLLRVCGASVTHRIADTGHGISLPEVQLAMAWLQS